MIRSIRRSHVHRLAQRVVELTRDIDLDCSHQNRGKYADLREMARAKVARQT